jgi:hypothetical protein
MAEIPYVYLSFADADAAIAKRVATLLERRGIRVVVRSVEAVPFGARAAHGIEGARAVVVIVSRASLQDPAMLRDALASRSPFMLLHPHERQADLPKLSRRSHVPSSTTMYSLGDDLGIEAFVDALKRSLAEVEMERPQRASPTDSAMLGPGPHRDRDRLASEELRGDPAALSDKREERAGRSIQDLVGEVLLRPSASPPIEPLDESEKRPSTAPASRATPRVAPHTAGVDRRLEINLNRPAEVSRSRTARRRSIDLMRAGKPQTAPNPRLHQSALIDTVRFGVTAPTVLVPGSAHSIDVWAFVESMRRALLKRAAQESGARVRLKSQGPVSIARGARLGVRLRVGELAVRPARASLLWDGELSNVGFVVEVPGDAPHGSLPGTAIITLQGFPLVRLAFTITIGSMPERTRLAEARETRYRTAFASYSSKDRPAVMARVHGLQKAGVDVFLDVLSLRSGQNYERVLLEMVQSRDVFYLFWSRAAKRSEWVEREWRLALQKRGIEYIDPFPLESPTKAPPPEELGGTLHFNDWMLAYMERNAGIPWWRFWERRF